MNRALKMKIRLDQRRESFDARVKKDTQFAFRFITGAVHRPGSVKK